MATLQLRLPPKFEERGSNLLGASG